MQSIHDILRLGECGVSMQSVGTEKSQFNEIGVFVSINGSDSHGDGSMDKPFATIERALIQTRASSELNSVVMMPGTYFFGRTVALGPSDANTTIAAHEPGTVSITGALPLTGMTWSKSPIGPTGTLVTNLVEAAQRQGVSLDLSRARTGLTVEIDAVPYTLARYPNANPVFDLFPAGYASTVDTLKDPRPAAPGTGVVSAKPFLPQSHFPTYERTVQDPKIWHQGHGVGGVVVNDSRWQDRKWTAPYTGVAVHWDGYFRQSKDVEHESYWDQWMNYGYEIVDRVDDPSDGSSKLLFGDGGWQGLNGDSGTPARPFYVYNVKEELDVPGEWWLDPATGDLHVLPNRTEPLGPSTIVALSQLETVLSVQGLGPEDPVSDVGIDGITFTGTTPTFLRKDRPYTQPILNVAGWSVYLGAAVVVRDATRPSITRCTFQRTGGNGVLLRGGVVNASIKWNEFTQTGDSGVVAWGEIRGPDATYDQFVDGTVFEGNFAHDLGLLGKQISAWTQFGTARTLIRRNVLGAMPRAAVNIDDGIFGGNLIEYNVGFESVRESADHGWMNLWSREQAVSVRPWDGAVTPLADWSGARKNLVLAAGGTLSNFDGDDGTRWLWKDHNSHAYAGAKNYLGHSKHNQNSVHVLPDLGMMKSQCMFSDGDTEHAGYGETYINNTCILLNATVAVESGGCQHGNETKTSVSSNGNTYYVSKAGGVQFSCGKQLYTQQEWESMTGNAKNSKVQVGLPAPAKIASMMLDTVVDDGGEMEQPAAERKAWWMDTAKYLRQHFQ